MYDLTDTIVAVSSPSEGLRSIVRITGPKTFRVCLDVFKPAIPIKDNGIVSGLVIVDEELAVDAKLYLFHAPHSYTGETLAELHITAPDIVVEAVVRNLLGLGLRPAGPGEFTARAYLNGKIDLAQAEAVNEIVVSSNRFQLAAAEKLLSGRLAETTAKVHTEIMECLSLVEAGLDFSGEDIEFISRDKAIARLTEIRANLERLLYGSISYESIIDLPAVGIAGAPNAGKSSLLNALHGSDRSIVSEQPKTTRDVVTTLLELEHCRCILFDCAGLLTEPENILDELAQQAATEALRNSDVVLFCVDVSKTDWREDMSVRGLISLEALIPVVTKVDLLCEGSLSRSVGELNDLFGCEFLPVSAQTGFGLEQLLNEIDKRLVAGSGPAELSENARDSVALTARHKQAVTDAIENIADAGKEIQAGNDEVAAMLMRAAYQAVSAIERQTIDEQVLDRIFSRFCIGK